MNSLRNIEELTRASGLVNDPSEGRNGSNGRCDKLDHEEVLETRWWDEQERQLNDPEEEVGDHAIG